MSTGEVDGVRAINGQIMTAKDYDEVCLHCVCASIDCSCLVNTLMIIVDLHGSADSSSTGLCISTGRAHRAVDSVANIGVCRHAADAGAIASESEAAEVGDLLPLSRLQSTTD